MRNARQIDWDTSGLVAELDAESSDELARDLISCTSREQSLDVIRDTVSNAIDWSAVERRSQIEGEELALSDADDYEWWRRQ